MSHPFLHVVCAEQVRVHDWDEDLLEWAPHVKSTGSGGPSSDVNVTNASLPVTGTFWQATQPVSLASVPSHAVTNAGTFAVQVTSAPTTTVTGTITANVGTGTQPVSATSLPLPSGASTETTLAAIKAQTDKLTFTGTALQITGGAGGGGGDGAILDGTDANLKAKVDAGGRLYVKSQADATWYVWAPAQACAQNKIFLAILNTGAQVLRVKKLFLQNAALAAVTGVALQFDVLHRITAISGGTTTTPLIVDSTDAALANVTSVRAPTSVTGGTVAFSWFTNNDEVGATGGFPQATMQGLISLLPEGLEVKEMVLNQNEGVCLKQITSTAVGSFGVLAVITRDA